MRLQHPTRLTPTCTGPKPRLKEETSVGMHYPGVVPSTASTKANYVPGRQLKRTTANLGGHKLNFTCKYGLNIDAALACSIHERRPGGGFRGVKGRRSAIVSAIGL